MKTKVVSPIALISLLIIGYFGDGAAGSSSDQNLTEFILGCGGLIRTDMLPIKSSYKLRYKPNVTTTTKKNCIWTFDNESVKQKYYVKAKVTLLDTDLFETSGAAIAVFNWNFRSKSTDTELSHKELRKNSPTYLSSDWDYKLFLSYTSASNTSIIAKSGFLVRIEKFGPYHQHHGFSLVINPQQTNTTFTVNFVDSKKTTFCSGADTFPVGIDPSE